MLILQQRYQILHHRIGPQPISNALPVHPKTDGLLGIEHGHGDAVGFCQVEQDVEDFQGDVAVAVFLVVSDVLVLVVCVDCVGEEIGFLGVVWAVEEDCLEIGQDAGFVVGVYAHAGYKIVREIDEIVICQQVEQFQDPFNKLIGALHKFPIIPSITIQQMYNIFIRLLHMPIRQPIIVLGHILIPLPLLGELHRSLASEPSTYHICIGIGIGIGL